MFNNVAYLGSEVLTSDDYGNQMADHTWREVYVREQSLRQSEFYQAAQAGLKPDFVLAMAQRDEYHGEKIIRYNNSLYSVTRVYINRGHVELTVTRRLSNE